MLYVIREGVHCVVNFMSSREFIMSLVLVQRHDEGRIHYLERQNDPFIKKRKPRTTQSHQSTLSVESKLTNTHTMKLIQLFTTSSLYLVLNNFSAANASFLQGKSCDYLNDTMCGRDKFCQAAPGDCRLKSASIPGNCVVPPVVCTKIMDPVCGCDGKLTTPNN